MQTLDYVSGLHNFREFSQPSECLDEAIKEFSKILAHLKRHNRVYILSSKHTYRPMRARVVAQLLQRLRSEISL